MEKEHQPENIDEGIHTEDYLAEYKNKKIFVNNTRVVGGDKKICLDGEWNYAIDQYDTFLRQKWFKEIYEDEKGFSLPVDFSFDSWPTMKLPCSWNMEKELLMLYEGSIVFTRTFDYGETPKPSLSMRWRRRSFLRIGAANYICRVFLNGEYLGQHDGGSTPFYVDITPYLQEKNNRIILQVDATRRPTQVPTENTDWFNYGGIYRSIEIIETPCDYIEDFSCQLVNDGSFDTIRVYVAAFIGAGVDAKLKIPELGIDEELSLKDGRIEKFIKAKPQLWSPENPKLYDVELSWHCKYMDLSYENDNEYFEDDGLFIDRIGFRDIQTRGTNIYLNGEPIFLKGTSCHEDDLYHGKALTDSDRLKIIDTAKELGCNFIRLAHYPHDERMAKLADEMGILLWEEIPVYWAIRFSNGFTAMDAKNQLEELIRRDINRASVIIWSVGNENPDTDDRLKFMSMLSDVARRLDPSRLISAACLVNKLKNRIEDRLTDKLDVIGINEYKGWYDPDFSTLPELFDNSNPDKPVIITEFGADAMPGLFGDEEEKGNENCQAAVYAKQIEVLKEIAYIKGMTPWILFDFRCPRRTSSIQQYFNRKGLVAADREYRKKAFYVLRDFYKNV